MITFVARDPLSTTADGALDVFAVDVDGDGDLDVLSASALGDKIAWYENDGSQNFTPHTISTTADGAWSVFAADVDGDGDMDVFSASANDDTIAWYENLGDGTPALSIDDVSLAEGDSGETDFTFTISIDVASASDVNVDFATADDSAGAPDDYTAISGTATIVAGATSTTLTVKVQGDTAVEPDETVLVNLSNPVNATIADNQGLGTINNDDTALPTIDLDVDANGDAGALTDGVLIVRYLFGVTGTQLTDGALGTGAVRTDPAEIIAFLEPGLTTMLDVDANGEATALTDGVLIVRYLFGVTGTQLTDGALGTGSLRTDPVEIIAFLDGFLPAAASASLVVSTQDTLIANYDAPAVSVGIPGNVDTGPNFAQDTFNDASTTNVVTTTSDVVLPTTVSGPLLYPALTEEESDDEALAEEAPVIVPEEQAELEILFGDLDGSLQDELLTV